MAVTLILSKEQKKNSAELEEFLKKEENQKTIALLVVQFKEIFENKWFTLIDCSNIFKTHKIEQIIDILRTLYLCGFISAKEHGAIEQYRLTSNAFKSKILDASGK